MGPPEESSKGDYVSTIPRDCGGFARSRGGDEAVFAFRKWRGVCDFAGIGDVRELVCPTGVEPAPPYRINSRQDTPSRVACTPGTYEGSDSKPGGLASVLSVSRFIAKRGLTPPCGLPCSHHSSRGRDNDMMN